MKDESKHTYAYVQNPNGFVYDIPVSQLAETLKRKGFKFIGYEEQASKEMEELFKDISDE